MSMSTAVPTPLDLWHNEFLTKDGRHLIRPTHGVTFERLPVEADGPAPVVRCPG